MTDLSQSTAPRQLDEPFLPFSRPSIGAEEVAAVSKVLTSGWITTGPQANLLEERFADSVGAPTPWPCARPPRPCT